MLIANERLDVLFDEVAKQVANSVLQTRESILRSAHQRLRQNAADVATIHVIAAAQIRNHQPHRSLRVFQQHTVALENDATGHRLTGYAYLTQQNTTAARAHFDVAVRLDPRQYDCWTLLGRIDEQRGLLDQAAEYYQRAIFFENANHEAALALSGLYLRTDRLNRAIATLRSVLRRDRRSARLNSALATLLLRRAGVLRRKRKSDVEVSVLEQAVACYQKAIASAPHAETYTALGRLQQRLGNFTEAASAFGKAVQMNSRCTAAITSLANNAVDSGDIDEALKLYRKVFDISPDFAPAHFKYSRAQRFKCEDPTIRYAKKLTELVSDPNRRPREQVQLNFALAKVLDDIGQYDRAWQHYDRANRLKTGHSNSLRGANQTQTARIPLLETVDRAVMCFTSEFFSSKKGIGNPSSTPVFIVGMPRSGTTLTEQILSSHPDVVGAGELKEIERLRRRIASDDDGNAKSVYPNMLASIDDQEFTSLADNHLSYLNQLRGEARFVTDKMPTNFIHLGLIAILFPNATIIHCRRDPMDVLVSCYCQNLSAPFCDLRALAQYHQQYRRLMAHWQKVLPLKIHSIDYEALVSDPEVNSRRLLQSCGLPWDERCLNFHANDRAVHTPSKWQVRQPMYRSSVGKWKRFEAHLKPIVDLVNQDYESAPTSSSSEFHSSVA